MTGSTEEEQFKEKTPDFVEAEVHHSTGEGKPVEPTPRLVAPVEPKVVSAVPRAAN